ncbi:hypothetical protein [Vibrio sp. M250220]
MFIIVISLSMVAELAASASDKLAKPLANIGYISNTLLINEKYFHQMKK